MLDGAPLHLEEVEDEVRAGRDLQETRAGGAVGEHLQQPQHRGPDGARGTGISLQDSKAVGNEKP
jgi:hypothetical protein